MKLVRYFLALLLSTGLALAPVSTAHAGLESATYINGLVATNPIAGDPVSQADDHIRLTKSTLLTTFPNITGAVTPTHTELNYVDGVTSAIQTQLDTITTNVTKATLTSGTLAASTSGTSIDFTSIPSWVKRITFNLNGVSTSGTSFPIVQIGDSGGVETSGYLGSASQTANSSSTVSSNFTTGFGITGSVSATTVLHGRVVLELMDAATNLWSATAIGGQSNIAASFHGGGNKSLSGTLDRVRLTTFNGTDTFDAGSVNILYE